MNLQREINKAEKEMIANMAKTESAKQKFIMQIRTGLGKEIKETSKEPIIIKRSWWYRLKQRIKKFFKRS